MITACHNCKIGPGPACQHCKRVNQDDIRIQHTPHNRSELQATAPQTASEKATNLPEDIENTLRTFLYDLFDLSPVELLLLQHVRKHGTPVSFCRCFSQFLKGTIKYGERTRRAEWNRAVDEIGANIGRATTKAIWDGMIKRLPLLAVFQTWDKGHGGRQADEEIEDEPRCVQGELDFGTGEAC